MLQNLSLEGQPILEVHATIPKREIPALIRLEKP
jgi:hypothetical protein